MSAPARAPEAPVPPCGGTAVEGRGLTKRYGRAAALDGVDLTVERGSVHGLLGPNGAGKTTLLRAVLGLVRPDAGTLRVLGRTGSSAGTAFGGVAGFVESPRFYPYLSARRNLDLLAALDGPPAPDRVDAALDTVGLESRAGAKVRGFSTGERQRLGLAAALLSDPRLLVLDEPATGLDPAGIRELHALVREFAAAGRTVLLSSHHLAEVEALCDAVTVLRGGRRVHEGSLQQLREASPDPVHLLSTSDDAAAAELARELKLPVSAAPEGGLAVRAEPGRVDELTVRLGRAGVAVRGLSREDTSLEALFLRLVHGEPAGGQP